MTGPRLTVVAGWCCLVGVKGSVEWVGARLIWGGGACMAFNALVNALPWPALGGGGRLLVGWGWADGEGTAPGWGGGGTASCEGCVVRVGVGCANGVAVGTAAATGCAFGYVGGGPPATAVVMPASVLDVLVGSG